MGHASGSRIVILEHDPERFRALSETLRNEAYQVSAQGADGTAIAAECEAELLILGSIPMHVETAARLRLENVPVLALSAIGHGHADAFLPPPFTAQELLDAVALLVQMSRERHERTGVTLVDVGAVLERAIQRASEQIADRAQITREFDTQLRVLASAEQLCLVVLNLLVMAVDRMDPSRRDTNGIRIAGWRTAEGRTVIEISDNGRAIPARRLERLFDAPNGTGEPSARGLSLVASQDAVSTHGGAITVTSTAAGSRFRVELPTAAA